MDEALALVTDAPPQGMPPPGETDTPGLEARHGSGLIPGRGIELVRAEGFRVWDHQGREYLDFVAGVGVANLGHGHPRLLAALREQAARMITCYASFGCAARAAFYHELARVMPAGLDRFFLSNSGTEAVEAALKFARVSTGRPGVVSFLRGFHGKTMGALSATHNAKYQDPVRPLLDGFHGLRFNDVPGLEAFFATRAAAPPGGSGIGAVILELVQGEGGVHPARPDFVAACRSVCDRFGAKLIFDEVQTGVGRTGRAFAHEHFGVVPDLLCGAKALAGGLPVGVTAFGAGLGELPSRIHSSTFGGNALVSALGAATLQTLRDEELPARAARLGERFLAGLRGLGSRKIREVRGLGLMIGVELKERAGQVLDGLQRRGILALLSGTTVLRFLPPLVIDEAAIDRCVATLGEVLDERA